MDALIEGIKDDICLNISEINYTLYIDQIDIINDCKKNNFYNISYIVLETFEEEDKNSMD